WRGENYAWLSPLPDDSSDRLFAERRWKKLGVNSRPARNHDQNILRMIGNPDVLWIACDLKPAGAALKNPPLRPFSEFLEGDVRLIEQKLFYLLFAKAIPGERPGVLGSQDKQRPGWEYDVVVTEAAECSDKSLQNFLSCFASVSKEVL